MSHIATEIYDYAGHIISITGILWRALALFIIFRILPLMRFDLFLARPKYRQDAHLFLMWGAVSLFVIAFSIVTTICRIDGCGFVYMVDIASHLQGFLLFMSAYVIALLYRDRP